MSAAPHATTSAVEQVGLLDGLDVVYEGGGGLVHAVRGLDLAVRRGEILAMVGESGSGKSSAAMSLLGLLGEGRSPARIEGEASVLGVDMTGPTTDERRALRRTRLGAVFQDPTTSLNPTMTIGRQLREVAGSAERAEALLDAVGVPEARLRLRSYPHELSGGQRQRVMIAMAIAGDPALIVADEPTTALDVTIQAQILELIKRLRDDLGCAFIVVTHNLGVAAQIADRIAVCYAGRVVEIGPSADILNRPTHPYTAALLRSRITLASDRTKMLPTLPGEPPDLRRPPAGCPFAPRCAYVRPACTEAVPPLLEVTGHPQESACIRAEELEGVLAQTVASAVPRPSLRLGPATEPVLRLAGIRKSFPVRAGIRKRLELHALRGVDLEVRAGECVAVVGESGCGKSTLLRVIAGLIDADGGDMQLAPGAPPQMVFQDAGASLTPWLSVGEQIGERLRAGGVTRAEVRARVSEVLERVGLGPEVADRRPVQLSGGQRQRVAIARAIAVPPPVLLCDEPTSSLDVSLAATILNLIDRLRQDLGVAVLFVTHDLAAARYVADRVAVMYLGRVVEVGPADEVAANPSHPYTRALLSAVPDIDRVAPRVAGELPSPLNPPTGCPYHPRCPVALPSCSTEDQPLRVVDPGHGAACVHVDGEPS